MKTTKALVSSIMASTLALAPLLAPVAALADTNVDVSTTAHVSPVNVGAVAKVRMQERAGGMGKMSTTTRMENAGARGDSEITKRIASLNALSARVQAFKHLTADQKSSIAASISAQIAELTTLKAKIAADTDPAVLKADMQSITKAYRIYALIMPQTAIISAADRTQSVVTMMQSLQTKLSARITAAQTAGVNVSAALTANADISTKLADASVQASAAINEVASLKPDNGDKAVFTSNQTSLKDARAKIKVATQDLKAARADVKTILDIVKGHGDAKDSKEASTTESH